MHLARIGKIVPLIWLYAAPALLAQHSDASKALTPASAAVPAPETGVE